MLTRWRTTEAENKLRFYLKHSFKCKMGLKSEKKPRPRRGFGAFKTDLWLRVRTLSYPNPGSADICLSWTPVCHDLTNLHPEDRKAKCFRVVVVKCA